MGLIEAATTRTVCVVVYGNGFWGVCTVVLND